MRRTAADKQFTTRRLRSFGAQSGQGALRFVIGMAGLVGLLFVLSGCTGEVSPDAQGSTVKTEAATEEQAVDGAGDETGADDSSAEEQEELEPRSPIQIFFDQSPYNEERHRETEELVFVCMKREGFDYVITEFEDGGAALTGLPEAALELGPLEFAETYGFAISTTIFSQASVGPGLLGYELGAKPEPPEIPESITGLDEAGEEAYGKALFGKPVSGGEDFVQGGCLGEAQRALIEDDPYYEFTAEFEEELGELYEVIRQDPRLTELEDNTSRCVTSTGYDPWAIQDEMTTEVRAMWEAHIFDALQLTPDEMFDLEHEQYWDARWTVANHPLSDQLRGQLAELQAREVEVASAVAGCDDLAVSEQRYLEVSAEYEEKFLADNLERLRFYQAELESSSTSSSE